MLKQYINGDIITLSKKELQKSAKLAELFIVDHRGVLYYCPSSTKQLEITPRLVVPEALIIDMLRAYHDEMGSGAHQGVSKTYEKLKRHYYWKGMYADIEKYVLRCTDCCTGKGMPKFMGKSPGNIIATRPFQIVSMDFAIPLPVTSNKNTALLLFTCSFTGFIILVPMSDTSAQAVAQVYLDHVFRRFGGQEIIRHDRDPRFMSRVFRAFCSMMKHKQRATLAYRPQANGQQERSVQTVMKAIKLYIEDEKQADWDAYTNRLEFALNNGYNFELKNSSFYLVHGWNARSMIDAMIPPLDHGAQEMIAWKWRNNVARSHEYAMKHARDIHIKLKQKRADTHNAAVDKRANNKTRTSYNVGEFVWLYFNLVKPGMTKKLAHLWHGPFRIAEKINEFTYKVDLTRDTPYETAPRFFPLIHISRLKLYESPLERPQHLINPVNDSELIDFDESLLPEDSWEADNEAGEYEVEAICNKKVTRLSRTGRMRTQYLIKWKGYDTKSWVDEDELSCGALLYEYEKKQRKHVRFSAIQTADEEGDMEL